MKYFTTRKITTGMLFVIMVLSIFFSTGVFAANVEVSDDASVGNVVQADATATATDLGVEYRGHVQDYGDTPANGSWIESDKELGTTGEGKRIEGFWIKLNGTIPEGASIKYNVHVENEGWQAPTDDNTRWIQNGDFSGTRAKSLRVEAIQIVLVDVDGKALPGYSVQYKVHIQDYGWSQGWKADGKIAGTSGEGKRLEAIQIKIVKLEAQAYDTAGTFGPKTGIEEINNNVVINKSGVVLQNLHIKGNLTIGEGVGEGDVTLNNVIVDGNTYVQGGGKNSIHINGGQYNNIIVQQTSSGQTRIVAVGADGLEVVISEDAKGEDIILEGAFDSVKIDAPNVKVSTQGDTKIGEFNVAAGATGSRVTLDSKTTVDKLVLDEKIEMKGQGTVKEANVNASGVTFEKAPDKQIVEPGVTPPVVTPPVAPTPGGGTAPTALAKVSNAALSVTGVATWDNVANESSFDVQLYKDGSAQGTAVNVAADTLSTNLLSEMRAAGTGAYTVTVAAKGDGVIYTNGLASDASSAQTVIQPVTVTAGLTWAGDVAHWTDVANAVSYDVQLYKGGSVSGTPVNVLAANIAAGADFAAAITAAGPGIYTYKVTAKGNATLIIDAAAASVASNNNVKTAALAKVSNAALLATGIAMWDNVANESSFDVQLYKNGSAQGTAVNVSADTLSTNLLSAMRAAGAGAYTVTVTAKGDGVIYTNGLASEASSVQAVIQPVMVIAGLTWVGDVAHWTTIANAVSYDVQLYKGGSASGTPVNVLAANIAAGADFAAAITAAGPGIYTYKVTAKGNATLIIDAAAASVASNNNVKTAALAKVSNAALLATGIATWDNVANESGFDVQLYKNGSAQGTAVNVSADTLSTNLLSAMQGAGAGAYTVTVTAKGDGVLYTNGLASEASSIQAVIQPVTVTAGLTWAGDVAHWTDVANAVSYDVQLYKGGSVSGTPVNVLAANAAAGADFAAAITAAGPGTYTYKVTAKGNATLIIDAAAASVASNNNVKTAALEKVSNVALTATGIATWDNVANESGFDVQLYKDGSAQGAAVNVSADTLSTSLLLAMQGAGAGAYTVTVTAKGDGVLYTNGLASEASSARTVIQLETVTAGLTWSGDVAHWTTVANAMCYYVQLYKDGSPSGTPVNVLAANAAAGADFGGALTGGSPGTYTYKVTAKGNAALIIDAVASAASNNNVKTDSTAPKIVSVSVHDINSDGFGDTVGETVTIGFSEAMSDTDALLTVADLESLLTFSGGPYSDGDNFDNVTLSILFVDPITLVITITNANGLMTTNPITLGNGEMVDFGSITAGDLEDLAGNDLDDTLTGNPLSLVAN